MSVAQCVCLRPGWLSMAFVFYNGELTVDHGLLSVAAIPAPGARLGAGEVSSTPG